MQYYLEPLDARTHFDAGQIDPHFGTNGLTELTVPYSSRSKEPSLAPYQMATDANGRTIVAAFSNTRVTFRRLDPFGQIDAAFSASPLGQTFAYGGSPSRAERFDFAVDASNRIYLLMDRVVTRYTSSGKLDRTFGRNGRASVGSLGQAADLELGPDGRVWVAGSKEAGLTTTNQMAVVRLTADGKTDTAFADKGLFVAPAPAIDRYSNGGHSQAEAIRVAADGSAVLAGTGKYLESDRNGTTVLTGYSVAQSVKLTPQGRLDKTYGIRGVAQRSDLTDDVQWTYPAILGIRGSGAVVIGVRYATDNPDPDNAGGFYRSGITADGDVDAHEYRTLATDVPGTFLPTGDGSDFFVSSEGILKLGANSKVDTSFNGGKFLTIGTTASVANNGELTFAGTGSKQADGRFGVGRYFTGEGPSATFIPATQTRPAAALTFTVWYDDDDGVDASSLNNRDLVVTGPSFGAVAALTGTKTDKTTGRVIATYTLPTHGSAIKNGLYAVNLTGARLGMHDVDGNRPTARQIGSIVIDNT